ncbi:MAG TPA: MarR family transcriptional regulator [Clostridium sp.]|uniref:MarR family winged helix-turn-helix transcriptional regulator n=1 Tax=uncultured Clostridium sp. TaxID=59620 RepID=UPI000E8ECB3C|nr:helix-turn-helix domain-containing protein [uncultured Clostridium sp.]NLU08556.1 MarR family transcriptional regulator [Clostridiales bacterium]HBC98112.1 MarR family transcriptional regulator [Clostridium sp.]
MDNSSASILIKLTNSIYRCTQMYVDKKLKRFDLTTGTYPYLLALRKREGISQNKLSRELNVDKSLCSRSVKKLTKLGYIRSEENKEDIRAHKLYITDKAKKTIPQIIKIIQQWIHILVQGIDGRETAISIKFLERVLNNGTIYKEKCCERMKKT